MSVSLLDEVRRLLMTRPANMSYAEICEKTGLSVNDLKRVSCHRAAGMPTGKVQALYEHLAGKPLIGPGGSV